MINRGKLYVTLEDAKSAVSRLGFRTNIEYIKGYKQDLCLPRNPSTKYKGEWISWPDFLGTGEELYSTYLEAQCVAKSFGLKSKIEYLAKRKLDLRLPSNPNRTYKNSWTSWSVFLGTNERFYTTLTAAMEAAQLLGIRTSNQYFKNYKLDAKLPGDPVVFYRYEWTSWPTFLRGSTEFYSSYNEALVAVRKHGFQTMKEYKKKHKLDSKLHSEPSKFYAEDWQSWPLFLGTKKLIYPTLKEASEAAISLNFKTIKDYTTGYKKDARLPSSPKERYKSDWVSWVVFLGERKSIYTTLCEAQVAANSLGLLTREQYLKGYKKDSRLRSNPNQIYRVEWQSWSIFLLPKSIMSLSMLKQVCKVLDIKNSSIYKDVRKKYSQLPSKPERKFSQDWISWYDLLDIAMYYPFEEAKKIVQASGIKRFSEYRKLVKRLNDPRLPKSPTIVYEREWTNWYDFFGEEVPFQPSYINKNFSDWKEFIEEFMVFARGGGAKKQHICKFIRLYIEKYDLGNSPIIFLTREKTIIEPFKNLLEDESATIKKKWIHAVNQFLNWIIETKLTIEDEDTGQLIRIGNARNPFKNINFDGETYDVVRNETNKPDLPYANTKAAREWIFPLRDSILDYSNLSHLQKFNGDWIELSDVSLLDYNDPDCITKKSNGKIYIWNPIYWTYTYALMHLPARGRQIVYSDSGEADKMIPEIVGNKVVWVDNVSALSGKTIRQGMVCQFEEGEYGVHYTSNKTQMSGKGYSIPYMPFELACWLIRLREWQKKYNPILHPTPWEVCQGTNLNLMQRKKKGSNCFLFRDFNGVEPGIFGLRLSNRLACSLFFSSPEDLPLAYYEGKSRNEFSGNTDSYFLSVSKFKSEFTPHSMRVSLINAFVFEFGLPVEDVMKLVGHSSIVMTIYYLKSNSERIRRCMEKGEKIALKDQAIASQRLIEHRRIEECKNQLIANDEDFLNVLTNKRHPAGYLFKDFGFCSVGGSRCGDGGEYINGSLKMNLRHPVNAGYLGSQNCIRCRFFVTGVPFMGGLVALANEISLQVRVESGQYHDLCEDINCLEGQLCDIDDEIYQCGEQHELDSELFLRKNVLNQDLRKLNSEMEVVAKRIDLYCTDIQYCVRHLRRCNEIIKITPDSNNFKSNLQMVIQSELDMELEAKESSYFHQLCEVCENAEIYQACSGKLAVTPRSQFLDRLSLNNGMVPKLFTLPEKTQHLIGNQMVELLMSRLRSWEKLDDLIDGRMTLADLDSTETVTLTELDNLFKRKLINTRGERES